MTSAVLVLLGLPGFAARAQDATAEADKNGWWNRLAAHEGLSSPLLMPTVPANALAVGAAGGEPDKIAAVGILMDMPTGAVVEELLLNLRESSEPGSKANETKAEIVACPITSFWGEAHNGAWESRPAYDCDFASAAGERSENGLWSFDLTELADVWTGETPLDRNGVALVPDPSAAEDTFQVAFRDRSTGDISVFLTATAPQPTPQPTPQATPEPVAPPVFVPDPPPVVVPEPVVTPVPTERPPPAILETEPAVEALPDPDIWGGLGAGVALLFLIVLVLAVATSYSLGPAGEPRGPRTRRGAVSRALDRSRRRS